MYRTLPALFIFLMAALTAATQDAAPDSLQQQRADHMAAYYHGFMGENSFLYTGRAYFDSPPMEGHAYYDGPTWNTGSVVYDGIEYKNILLKYDVLKNLLVVQRPNRLTQASLQNRLVSSFTMGDKNFIHLQAVDERGDSLLSFYQVLAPGKLTILVQKQKIVSDQIRNMQMVLAIIEKTNYYARYEGKYYPLHNPSSLLDIVPDKRRDLQQQLRKQKIKYRREPERALLTMAAYYNQLMR